MKREGWRVEVRYIFLLNYISQTKERSVLSITGKDEQHTEGRHHILTSTRQVYLSPQRDLLRQAYRETPSLENAEHFLG